MPLLKKVIDVQTLSIDGYQCDICKKETAFDGSAKLSDICLIKHTFGYGTSRDGSKVEIAICDNCLIAFCLKQKIPIHDE